MRNLFRGDRLSFAFDGQALVLAQEAIAQACDCDLPVEQRSFLYMPYMHSEFVAIHKIAIELFSSQGLESTLEYEVKHKKIIDRFGRYPHRNKILERNSSDEEIYFLQEPGSSF